MKKYILFFILLLTALTGNAGGTIMKLESHELVVSNKPTALTVGEDGMLYVAMASQEYDNMEKDQSVVHSKIVRFASDEDFLSAKNYEFICDVDGVILNMAFFGSKLLGIQFKNHADMDERKYNLISLNIQYNTHELISQLPTPVERLEAIDKDIVYALSISTSYASADGGKTWRELEMPRGYRYWARHGDDLYVLSYTQVVQRFFTVTGEDARKGNFIPKLEWDTKKGLRSPLFNHKGELFFSYIKDNQAFLYNHQSEEMIPLLGRKLKQTDAYVTLICSDAGNGIFVSVFENAAPLSQDARLVRYRDGMEHSSRAFVNVPTYIGQTKKYVYFVSPLHGEWDILGFLAEELR